MKKRPTGHRWTIFLLPVVLVALCIGGYYLCLRLPSPHRGSTSADIVHSEYRFGDVNKTHLSAARKNGIKPVAERADIPTEDLIEIESCKQYLVGYMAHSSPYLTPAAAELLDEIAVRFQTALKEQGLEKHRIIVTSILRTGSDVKRLRDEGRCYVKYETGQHCFHITSRK